MSHDAPPIPEDSVTNYIPKGATGQVQNEGERKYQRIFENTKTGIVDTTQSGTIVTANLAVARIFGYESADELLRTAPSILSRYANAEDRTTLLRQLEDAEIIVDYEVQMLRKDGSVMWACLNTHLVRETYSEPHYHSTVEDITAHKNAEAVVEEAAVHILRQRRLTITTELVVIAGLTAVVFGLSGYFHWFEAFTTWITQHRGPAQIDELVVTSVFLVMALLVFSFRRWRESEIEITSQRPVQEALRVLRADLEMRVKQRTNELRATNEALRQGEERYRMLFDRNPLPMWLSEPESLKFMAVNEAATKQYGYTREEFLAMKVTDIRPQEDVPQLLRFITGDGAERNRTGEWRHLRKDGSIIQVEIYSRPLTFNHRPARLVLAVDVTEKKLMAEKLIHGQRIESLGMLAGGIAHDLNNILSPITMMAGMLQEKLTDPEDRELLTMMHAGARRGADIIKQLLTFSRGQNGERTDVQPKHLINELVQLMRVTFPREIDLRKQVPTSLWLVSADPTQLHQVLLNLCVNARDAMPTGGSLTLAATNVILSEADTKVSPRAKPGPYVVIEIRDTGHGIPPDIKHRVFDPFFTTKPFGKGTGLGLSTVLGIVQSHGGFVDVDSVTNQGSTFKIYLPAITDGVETTTVTQVPATNAIAQKLTILVVDDERVIRDTTRVLLERKNYEVITAVHGQDALEQYLQHRGDVSLVLTDLMMPVMNGEALIRALRHQDPALKIIAMSGLSETDQTEGLAAIGVPVELKKPFDGPMLLATIDRVLTPVGE